MEAVVSCLRRAGVAVVLLPTGAPADGAAPVGENDGLTTDHFEAFRCSRLHPVSLHFDQKRETCFQALAAELSRQKMSILAVHRSMLMLHMTR